VVVDSALLIAAGGHSRAPQPAADRQGRAQSDANGQAAAADLRWPLLSIWGRAVRRES
jgi:hypothetical protein